MSQPLGNTYDKYGTRNPAERWLVERFLGRVTGLVDRLQPRSVLDIGCGEGVVTARVQAERPSALIVGADTDLAFLGGAAARRVRRVVVNALPDLCFPAGSFDLVMMTEVLEHIDRPGPALEAVAAVAARYALITVPHEPLWRISNMARLRYLEQWGNTPGHVQHFSARSLRRLLRKYFPFVRVRACFPWLIAVCDKAAG